MEECSEVDERDSSQSYQELGRGGGVLSQGISALNGSMGERSLKS